MSSLCYRELQKPMGEMADATDLKLRIERFQRLSPHIGSIAFYLGKSPKFTNFVVCQKDEQKMMKSEKVKRVNLGLQITWIN